MIRSLTRFDYFLIIASFLLYGAVASFPFRAKTFGDLEFHVQAKKVAGALWGKVPLQDVVINKAPGPVLFYALPYFIAGPDATDKALWFAGIAWSFVFMTFSLLLLVRAGNNMGNALAGKGTVILLLLIPLHLYYSLGILAEGMAFVGCCIAIYGFSCWSKSEYKGKVIYGLGLLFLIFARPNAAMIPLLAIFLYTILYFLEKNEQTKINFRKNIIFFVSLTVGILIAFAGIQQLTAKENASQETYFFHVAQHGRYQFRDETWDWRFWDNSTRAGSKDYNNSRVAVSKLDSLVLAGEGSYKSVYSRWIVDDIVSHPVVFIKQFFVRIMYGHTLTINSVQPEKFRLGPLEGRMAYYSLMGSLNVMNWTLILLAFFFAINKANRLAFVPLSVIWLGLVLFSSVVYMEQRYLFPARGIILFFAAMQITHLMKKYRPDLFSNPNS